MKKIPKIHEDEDFVDWECQIIGDEIGGLLFRVTFNKYYLHYYISIRNTWTDQSEETEPLPKGFIESMIEL